MRLVVDTARCIVAVQCVITAPAVFDQDEKVGMVAPRTIEPTPDLWDTVREAVRLRPFAALSIAE